MQTANGLAASYKPGAYRRDSIPVQEPLKNISCFAKSLEAGDFIERLPWGDYAGLDMHVLPQYVKNYQKKLESGGVGWSSLILPLPLHLVSATQSRSHR